MGSLGRQKLNHQQTTLCPLHGPDVRASFSFVHAIAKAIPGFAVSFDRHQYWWQWRERKPHPKAEELGYRTRANGFSTRRDAEYSVHVELERRRQLKKEAS